MSDPLPSESLKTCPKCGAELSAGDTNGLCPACLMAEVMQPSGVEAGAMPDTDAPTLRVGKPPASIPHAVVPDLPLPEELTALLPHGMYKVEGFLGQGGMGAVYKGTHVRLKRPVAIKIMHREAGRDYDFAQRFEREAQAMAKLSHPNIVGVHDYGEAGPDYLYIVMELVDGADMMDVIRTGRMTQEMALTLLPQICDALQFAHDHGIVHRDIKPSNIMLTRDGRVKMCDFGLAKRYDVESSFRTQTGTGMGTPDYAAPEQFDATAHIDHRADIYALGVMIYQMITGELPRGVWKPPSQRAPVVPEWDDIVAHAMQSDPADRYQHASEVKTDVSRITPPSVAQPVPAVSVAGVSPAAVKAPGKMPATHTGGTPVLRKKSRAPLLVGIIGTVVILAVGAFFAFKQPAGMPTDTGTISPSPALPVSASLLTAPWQPLFTEAEWQVPGEGREFKDGALHLKGGVASKELPTSDGAIRGRVRIGDIADDMSVFVRKSSGNSGYRLSLRPQLSLVQLTIDRGSGPGGAEILGRETFSQTLKKGDTVQLELRAKGSHLTALVNGVVLIESDDNQLTASGAWGVLAKDAWFESVEVQTLGPEGRAAAPPAAAGSVINLLAQVDVARDAVNGEWKSASDGVAGSGEPAPESAGIPRLQLAYEPPEEYDFEIEFTPTGGRGGVLQLLSAQGRNFTWVIGTGGTTKAPRVGFGLLDGKRVSSVNKTSAVIESPIKNGQRYRSRVEVRRGSLRGFFEGKEMLNWKGDFNRLSLDEGYQLPAEFSLGVGVDSRSVTFHEIKVREITGKGKLIHADAPSVSPSPSLPVSASSPANPMHTFAGHRYQFVPGAVTWDEAKAKAESMGGHLATVTSKDEHDWIVATFPPNFGDFDWSWLGASEETAGKWAWTTGEPFEFTRWRTGEPNRLTSAGVPIRTRPVVAMLARKDNVWLWIDSGPGSKGSFLVEWDNLGGGAPAAISNPPSQISNPAASSVATATKAAPFTNTLGMKFVPVPGTKVLFSIWHTRVMDYATYATAKTGVDGSWKTQQKDGVPVGRELDHPVVGVSWEDAQAFCKWLTEKESVEGKLPPGVKYRLPTDEEWSWAVGLPAEQGATPEEKNGKNSVDFPWGKDWPPTKKAGNYADTALHEIFARDGWINAYTDGYSADSSVLAFPSNVHGLHDMGGNAWQWCEDWWNTELKERVLRGASWYNNQVADILSSVRHHYAPTFRHNDIGFRVVLALEVK